MERDVNARRLRQWRSGGLTTQLRSQTWTLAAVRSCSNGVYSHFRTWQCGPARRRTSAMQRSSVLSGKNRCLERGSRRRTAKVQSADVDSIDRWATWPQMRVSVYHLVTRRISHLQRWLQVETVGRGLLSAWAIEPRAVDPRLQSPGLQLVVFTGALTSSLQYPHVYMICSRPICPREGGLIERRWPLTGSRATPVLGKIRAALAIHSPFSSQPGLVTHIFHYTHSNAASRMPPIIIGVACTHTVARQAASAASRFAART